MLLWLTDVRLLVPMIMLHAFILICRMTKNVINAQVKKKIYIYMTFNSTVWWYNYELQNGQPAQPRA